MGKKEGPLHCRQDLEFVLHSQRQEICVNKDLEDIEVRHLMTRMGWMTISHTEYGGTRAA